MYWKLVKGFYDEMNDPVPQNIAPECRSIELIVDVAIELMQDIECEGIDDLVSLKQKLTALTREKTNAGEFIQADGFCKGAPAYNDNQDVGGFVVENAKPWPSFEDVNG